MGIFSNAQRSRAANSTVCGGIEPNFELLRDIKVVHLTCMNEEDQIKSDGARVLTSLQFYFSEAPGQLTPKSVVEFRRNSNSSELLWLSLLPARNIAKSEQSSHTPGGSHQRPL